MVSMPTADSVAESVIEAVCHDTQEESHQQYLEKGGRGGRGQSAAKMCNDPIRCYG